MPAILMDNVPPELYEQVRRRADARRRPVQEEALDLLRLGLGQEGSGAAPRPPDLIFGEEVSPPCDLPRPGPAVPTPAYPGGPRLPDPLE